MRDLSRLFQPKSIAVFGGWWAENVITQCQKIGFTGEIWPVHPTRDTIKGVPCYKSVADLPAGPDAAFLGINRHAVIGVTADLAARNCGGAICFASGFAEAGDQDLQDQLINAAGEMPLLGPNCYGFLNYLDGAVLWPDQHGGVPVESGVALVSQSSNIVINMSMQARGLPIAYIACVGNQAQTSLTDMTDTLLQDNRVTAAGLYIEGIIDVAAFAAMADAARAAGKYLVAIKSGKTAASQNAATSHTAALAGDAAASSAFLKQCGVFEVDTPEEMLELLKILHLFGPLSGANISAMCCSGGETGLIADLTGDKALNWPDIPAGNHADLTDCLGELVAISNPLDYHTFIWGDEDAMTTTFSSMMGNWVDASVLVIDFPRSDRCSDEAWHPAVTAMKRASKMSGTKAIMLGSISEGISDSWASHLIANDIVPLCGLADGLRAIELAANYHPPSGAWRPLPALQDNPDSPHMLDEADAKTMLAAAGVPVPRGKKFASIEDITTAKITTAKMTAVTGGLTAPLVLKGLGHAHKSEAGLVQLGLAAADILPAATKMATRNGKLTHSGGFLIEEMVAPPIAELLVGLRRDPLYGISLTIGMGGVTAEILQDTVTHVLPIDEAAILAAFDQLKMAALLHGYRGKPAADCPAAAAAISAMMALITENHNIVEIEVNPLMLGPVGGGAIAADAVIWLADKP